jgi:hypothetical protein
MWFCTIKNIVFPAFLKMLLPERLGRYAILKIG